jgi:beta-xylosidase
MAGAVAALTVVAGAATAAASQPRSTPTPAPLTAGPVYTGDFPDPSVLVSGGRTYAYSTQSGGENIQVIVSTNLLDWTAPVDALPVLPPWASPGYTWAPAVAVDPSGGYQLFYAALARTSGLECIGRATSASPAGPFVDTGGQPFLCQTALGGSIDPSLFTDDGTDYLVWKSNGADGQPQQLWSQALNGRDDGLVGSSSLLLSATSSWENGVVEGPAMLQTAAGLFLYFSGNRWSTSAYAIGVVGCDSPLGPCVNAPTGQAVSTLSHLVGPGGPTFFTETDGQVMMAFAAWSGTADAPDGRRQLYMDRVDTTGTSPTLIELLVPRARRTGAEPRPGLDPSAEGRA